MVRSFSSIPQEMSSKIYSVDNVPQAVTDLVVTHIRLVAHTMGPVAAGARLSQNHWSLYLLHSKGSVRLNMQLQDATSNSSRGLLTVTNYPYTSVSNSAVISWEFEATTNLAVYYLIQAIIDNGRSNYDMAEGGVGCRYWISVVMADFAKLNYVTVVSTDGATIEKILQYNYSIGMDPVFLEIKQGTFLQNTQTSPAPIASGSGNYHPTTTYSTPIPSGSSNYYSTATYSAPIPSPTPSGAAYSQPTSNTTTLKDEDYVKVTLVRYGSNIASNTYRFQTSAGNVEKTGDQFYQVTNQNGQLCMVYYGVVSKRYYWTWSLEPNSSYVSIRERKH